MSNERLELMRRLLKPISRERAQEIAVTRTRTAIPHDRLTMADVGIEKEIKSIIFRINKRAEQY